MDILASEGYQAIDISLELSPPFRPAPKPHLTPAVDASRRARVRAHAEQAGIAIASLNSHTNLIADDPEPRRTNFEYLRGAIQLAADLGCPVVGFGGGRKELFGYEQVYWDRLADALRELVKIADDFGVTLAVESGSFYGNLIHSVERIQKLLSFDGLDRVRVLFDPAHYHIRGDSPVAAFDTLGDRVGHVHAKDARGHREELVFPPLGQGEIDFSALFDRIKASGYDGFVSVEYEAFAWGFPREPRQVLAESRAFLQELL